MGDLAAPALLIVTLAALGWFQRNSPKNFAAFAAIEDSRQRQRVLLRWAGRSCAFYLGVPLAGLALLGRLDALWRFPAEFHLLAAPLPLPDTSIPPPAAMGAAIGIVIVEILFVIRARLLARSAKSAQPSKLVALLPRNRAELLHLLPLILNAGISEEVFFRLYLPLLMVLCGVDAMIAFVAATVIFGALHRYQGAFGVIATTVVGGALALAYLAGDGLWLPVLLHLVLNLNGLLLRPAIIRLTARRAD